MQKDKPKDSPQVAIMQGTMDFFHYLQERPMERFSRFEAYIYMLDKACANYCPQNIEKKWIPAIGEGQFFITKTQLAADWHWHRATVRDFLARLTDFGCLVIEEHLKGILCTMPRLIVTQNSSIAVCFNFDSMAKYMMYSWADGRLKPHQVQRLVGQMERSARVMLDGTVVSAYAEKQLENITKMVIHYAIEAIIARHPGKLAATEKIGSCPSLVEKRTLEFFTEHLGGSWVALLSLFYKKTAVALDGISDAIHMSRTDRSETYKSLRNEAAQIKEVPLDLSPEGDISDANPDGGPTATSASISSEASSEGSPKTSPEGSGAASSSTSNHPSEPPTAIPAVTDTAWAEKSS